MPLLTWHTPLLGPISSKKFAKHMYLFIFILTPIHCGIGGLGALGDCGCDMCPENNQSIAHTWRQSAQSPGGRKPDARHRFGIRSFRPIRNNQPSCVLESGSPTRDMNSASTKTISPFPRPPSYFSSCSIRICNHQHINYFSLYFQVGAV